MKLNVYSNNGSSERDSFSEDERDKYFINDEDSFSTESYNHRSYEHMDEMHGENMVTLIWNLY